MMGFAITCHQSLPLVDSAKSWSCGLLKGLIKQPKNHILPIFSPNFTLNGQIWLFYAEKWIFSKKKKTLVLSLTHSPRKFHRKTHFEASLAVFWSLSCEALKLTTKVVHCAALCSTKMLVWEGMRRKQNFEILGFKSDTAVLTFTFCFLSSPLFSLFLPNFSFFCGGFRRLYFGGKSFWGKLSGS